MEIILKLAKKNVLQATTWVRKESEKLASDPVRSALVVAVAVPDVRACFQVTDVSATYDVRCSEGGSSSDKEL